MKLTHAEIMENAREFIGRNPLEVGEKIDRNELKQQMQYTIADDTDIESIASEIARLNNV